MERLQPPTIDLMLLHDVDYLPKDLPENIDRYSSSPKDPSTMVEHVLGAEYCLGGIVKITPKIYQQCDGFSIDYPGYGRADVDFQRRVQQMGFEIDLEDLVSHTETEYFDSIHIGIRDTANFNTNKMTFQDIWVEKTRRRRGLEDTRYATSTTGPKNDPTRNIYHVIFTMAA